MMLLSVKMYLAVVWGTCVLFSMESMSASIPGSSSINPTAEPNKTTKQQISAHVVSNETETQSVTWQPALEPAEISVAATAAEPTVPLTVETEEAIAGNSSDTSKDSTAGFLAMNTVTAATSSSGSRLVHASAAVTTAASEAQSPHSTAMSETAERTEGPLRRQSHTTSTDVTAPAASFATTSAAPQLPSTTKPGVIAQFFSTTSPAHSTQSLVFIQNRRTPSLSTTTTAKPTSEAAPAFEPTSLPVAINVTSTSSTERSPAFQPISTSQFTGTAGSSSTAEPPAISFSTDSDITTTATAVSTSPAGILMPKRLPVQTTTSARATTRAPHEASGTEAEPCSTRGVVKHCLIVIASLAALATIFMVSTIILCAKLSTRKYKVKKPQQATEMMCISSLLPERNYTYSRQRNPVANGVLVIHSGGDSDEDGGDNLTLSSFLPENDR
ncbi:P-selectin glycoprotein ligand 1 [Pempheris klunzingeri]|uniref:P-selectin glycoprotein ligand 1 n=1 Tax=Pempheris klunzingeri TaxID=3127111 RepID=UPI00397FE5CF